jgi:adenylosuccinate synthase
MNSRSKASIVLGAQYGDEGKGKLIDLMAEDADLVCRVQGGNNAGHTIWVGGQKVVTHLIPSAILRPTCQVGLAAGMVIDPFAWRDEFEMLTKLGVNMSPSRLFVDPRAHLILPYHRMLDRKRESDGSARGGAIGTTGRGIGPAYAGRAFRDGPRICDFITPGALDKVFEKHPHLEEGVDAATKKDLESIAHDLLPHVRDLADVANSALDAGKRILIEGAQGAMLDVSFGSYPFVTSSSLLAGSCPGNLGIPPWSIGDVIGVVKAYSTRVGNGPFVGELHGEVEEILRKKGNEFGSTTGRPRRVGWLDLVALKYCARINGITRWSLMKSDVLSGFDEVGLIVNYRSPEGGPLPYPTSIDQMEKIIPEIVFCKGWNDVVDVGQTLADPFRSFVQRIEQYTGVPVAYVSTGPDRTQGLWLR